MITSTGYPLSRIQYLTAILKVAMLLLKIYGCERYFYNGHYHSLQTLRNFLDKTVFQIVNRGHHLMVLIVNNIFAGTQHDTPQFYRIIHRASLTVTAIYNNNYYYKIHFENFVCENSSTHTQVTYSYPFVLPLIVTCIYWSCAFLIVNWSTLPKLETLRYKTTKYYL